MASSTRTADGTDEELLAEALRRRARGEDFQPQLAQLWSRWKEPAAVVVRRVQRAYQKGSPSDIGDIFQEATLKFATRGIDQFRGLKPDGVTKASLTGFFLRIVNHAAVDYYRRSRERLAPAREPDSAESPAEVQASMDHARRTAEQDSAREVYWRAFTRLEKEHPGEAAAWHLYRHESVEDHAECARLMGVSVDASFKRVSRAQAFLRLYVLELMEHEEN
jgi:RNA polymerase sigma-70 factor (ECF subfamily)